jgi:hypothetical protein
MLVGKPEGNTPPGRHMHRWYVIMQTGFIWLRIGSMPGSHEDGNEPSGSIKGREFLHQLNEY